MTLRAAVIVLATLLSFPWAWPSAQPAEKTLDVYFIDVEGGHATLYVAPSGQSMLVERSIAEVAEAIGPRRR